MSKSLGNVIDPLDVMGGITLQELQRKLEGGNLDPKEVERAKAGQKADYPEGIPECGTDAMRFALCAYTAQGRDINLDVRRVVGYRFFCNKIWNAMRFSLSNLGSGFTPNPTQELTGRETIMDHWILSRLTVAVDDCNRGFAEYDFPLVTSAIYSFWVYELCDVYIESLKPTLYGDDQGGKAVARNVLYTCLDTALLLISPFMPFLSEELYQRLPRRGPSAPPSICITPYPEQLSYHDAVLDARVKLMQEVVRVVRSMKQDYLPAKAKPEVHLVCQTAEALDILSQFVGVVTTLSQCSKVSVVGAEGSVPGGCTMTTVGASCQVHLQLKGLVDIAREVSKLEERISKIDTQLAKLRQQEQVEGYEEKVPIEVRDAAREKIQSLETERGQLEGALAGFRSMKG
jgi:valyl-tRNA synthetase